MYVISNYNKEKGISILGNGSEDFEAVNKSFKEMRRLDKQEVKDSGCKVKKFNDFGYQIIDENGEVIEHTEIIAI